MFHVYHEMIYILLKNNNENVHGVSFAQDPIIYLLLCVVFRSAFACAFNYNWIKKGENI